MPAAAPVAPLELDDAFASVLGLSRGSGRPDTELLCGSESWWRWRVTYEPSKQIVGFYRIDAASAGGPHPERLAGRIYAWEVLGYDTRRSAGQPLWFSSGMEVPVGVLREVQAWLGRNRIRG